MLNLSHKKLTVYKFSLELTGCIYELTKQFPNEEKFGLVAQLRRAAISVSSNIAEGASRISMNQKRYFFTVARSSLVEIDTQLEIAIMLKFGSNYRQDKTVIQQLLDSIFRILSKLIDNTKLNNN